MKKTSKTPGKTSTSSSQESGTPVLTETMKSENRTIPPSSTQSLQDILMPLTKDSPLLLIGTILTRQRLTGKRDDGTEWEMFMIEVRGYDGRVQRCTIYNKDRIPKVGEFLILAVYIGSNGGLRESRQLNGTGW
jgi:hypothetical protein